MEIVSWRTDGSRTSWSVDRDCVLWAANVGWNAGLLSLNPSAVPADFTGATATQPRIEPTWYLAGAGGFQLMVAPVNLGRGDVVYYSSAGASFVQLFIEYSAE